MFCYNPKLQRKPRKTHKPSPTFVIFFFFLAAIHAFLNQLEERGEVGPSFLARGVWQHTDLPTLGTWETREGEKQQLISGCCGNPGEEYLLLRVSSITMASERENRGRNGRKQGGVGQGG